MAAGTNAGEEQPAVARAMSEAAVSAPTVPAPSDGAAAGGGGGAAPPARGGEVTIKLFARTDVGQIREHNEDNFLVADLTKRTRGLLEAQPHRDRRAASATLFAVCDGMGGAAAGEIASQLAVDILYERMVDGLDEGHAVSRDEIARRLVRAIETAGLRIFQEAKLDRSRRGMGTTVTAAALVDDHLFFAQVGDSRGYMLRGRTRSCRSRATSRLSTSSSRRASSRRKRPRPSSTTTSSCRRWGRPTRCRSISPTASCASGDVMLLCSDGL